MNWKNSTANHYPKFWFQSFRFIQLITSGIVAGVMAFFVHHLRDTHVQIPWILPAAALTTFFWLIISSLLLYLHKLTPLVNAWVNGFTGLVWIGAHSLLSYRMGSMIISSCSTDVCGTEIGVLVCQLYKLLFSAAVVTMSAIPYLFKVRNQRLHSIATMSAFVLDIRTRQKDGRGNYGRAVDPYGKEPLRHRDIAAEDTQYLRPQSSEQLYDPGSSTSSMPLRTVSPASASTHKLTSEPYQSGRERTGGPGASRWKEVGVGA